MKKIFLAIQFTICIFFANSQTVNNNFPKATILQEILKKYTDDGLPGVSVAVLSEKDGWWKGVAGYAKTETKKAMTTDNLQYLQSISKSYLAVAILDLYEKNKIELDAPVTKYLPAKYKSYIKGLDKITVKMLLNHTSGVQEYSDHPLFVSYIMLHPTEVFNIEKALEYLSGESLQFEPGTKHHYVNTNYLLLAIIADGITGDHAAYVDKIIFKKLGLTNTYYRSSKGYLTYPKLVDSYWDVLSTSKPANITPLQKANVATLKGDDGIVATTTDAVKFLKGLVEGKLLKESTLALMKEWVNGDDGKPAYGLGLVHYEAGGLEGYGHSGGGVGAGCMLLYVPEKKIYVFMATNIATLFGGPLAKKADDMKNEVLGALLF